MFNLGSECEKFYSEGEVVERLYSLGELVWENSLYDPLEFIESTGQQYINLNYFPHPTKGRTEIVTTPSNISGTSGLWGYISFADISNRISLGISGNQWFGGIGETNYITSAKLNERISFAFDRTNKHLIVNGITVDYELNSVSPILKAFLFSRNGSNIEEPNGTSYSGKIYEFKEYNEDNSLYMHLIPARLKSSKEIGMWDLVSNSFFKNSGSGSFLTESVVSETFDIIEYVESTGNQWIDTGIPNTLDLIIEDQFMIYTEKTIFGDGQWIVGGRLNSNYALGVFNGTGLFNAYGGSSVSSISSVVLNEWADLYFTRFNLIVNEKSYVVSGQKLIPLEYETNVLLGKNQVNYTNTGNDPRNMIGKRRYTKITDATTGEVLREFVPRRSKESGKIGLLDLINNKFYTSAGSEDFIGATKQELIELAKSKGFNVTTIEEAREALKTVEIYI